MGLGNFISKQLYSQAENENSDEKGSNLKEKDRNSNDFASTGNKKDGGVLHSNVDNYSDVTEDDGDVTEKKKRGNCCNSAAVAIECKNLKKRVAEVERNQKIRWKQHLK